MTEANLTAEMARLKRQHSGRKGFAARFELLRLWLFDPDGYMVADMAWRELGQ